MHAVEELAGGMNHAGLVENIEKWTAQTDVLVTIKTMKYLVRSGHVSKMKGAVSKLLKLKPIIIVNDEGKSELVEKLFTEKSSVKMAMKLVDKKLYNCEL